MWSFEGEHGLPSVTEPADNVSRKGRMILNMIKRRDASRNAFISSASFNDLVI